MVSIRLSGSAVDKGESLKDTVQTLSAYDPAAIVIRSPQVGAAQLVARWTPAAVVNAGDGKHEHPTQALLDVYTIAPPARLARRRQRRIVGDVLHSRVARSHILAFTRMGADGHRVRTADADPARDRGARLRGRHDIDRPRRGRRRLRPADAAASGCSDSFVPSLREYAARYQITTERLRPGQLLMHPGPVNRGVELVRRGDRLARRR